MGFAENLKQARLERGLTQISVAEKLGVDKSTYSGYESGKRQPDVRRIKELATLLNVSADSLLGVDHAFSKNLNSAYRIDERYEDAIRNRPEVEQLMRLALSSSTDAVWKIVEIWMVVQRPVDK